MQTHQEEPSGQHEALLEDNRALNHERTSHKTARNRKKTNLVIKLT